jgi:hypothetical protein
MVRSKNTNQKDGMANSQRAPRVEAWRIIRCSKFSVVRNRLWFEIGVVRKSALFENQLSSDQLFDHRFPRHAEMKEQ